MVPSLHTSGQPVTASQKLAEARGSRVGNEGRWDSWCRERHTIWFALVSLALLAVS